METLVHIHVFVVHLSLQSKANGDCSGTGGKYGLAKSSWNQRKTTENKGWLGTVRHASRIPQNVPSLEESSTPVDGSLLYLQSASRQ
ncbi:unnamed protein product [Linum trigynum]|uniref:Secreted protein n=1 Tax=Linum trigynum TaxID=586398 RepID=A0AAV2CLN7_9ROSI